MFNRRHLLQWGALVLCLAIALVIALTVGNGGNKVVAEVNGEKVTRTQFDQYTSIMRLFMPQLDQMLGDKESRAAMEQRILDSMVSSMLIKQAATLIIIVVSAEEADAFYQQTKAELVAMVGPEEELSRRMSELKIDESELRDIVSISVYADKLYNFFLGQLTEERVRAFWAENPDLAKVPAMLEASHILSESLEAALSVRERLLAGEDFAALAEELSTDPSAKVNRGSLGQIPVDTQDFDADFMAGAKALSVGEISQPVKSPFGWHLIKVHSRTDATEKSFEEVRDEVTRMVAETEFEAYFSNLRQQASITYKL
ncbi:MAG: peptidyl-prolyl cis-trans isomerase [Firmicutes bacterium]|nr:peptidyl-prolyl cis-trans isomerase [Bacillota bacterium]